MRFLEFFENYEKLEMLGILEIVENVGNCEDFWILENCGNFDFQERLDFWFGEFGKFLNFWEI